MKQSLRDHCLLLGIRTLVHQSLNVTSQSQSAPHRVLLFPSAAPPDRWQYPTLKDMKPPLFPSHVGHLGGGQPRRIEFTGLVT